MFSIDRFIEGCRAVVAMADAERTVEQLVAQVVSDAASVVRALREPERAGFEVLHRGWDLTILNFAWPPWMCFKPHNHSMWSVVGIFSGREDNVFWRRTPDAIEAAGARSLGTGDVARFGRDIIHSVVNPIGKMTRAIHVYGGDFFDPPRPRSEWDPETLAERPWDLADTRHLFVEAEARARANGPTRV